MSELDQYTIQAENIASIDLMERAAMAVADELLSRYAATMPVVVFAGPGNNGGDALVVARRMAHSGYHVTCYLFNIDGHLSKTVASTADACKKKPRRWNFTRSIRSLNRPHSPKTPWLSTGFSARVSTNR